MHNKDFADYFQHELLDEEYEFFDISSISVVITIVDGASSGESDKLNTKESAEGETEKLENSKNETPKQFYFNQLKDIKIERTDSYKLRLMMKLNAVPVPWLKYQGVIQTPGSVIPPMTIDIRDRFHSYECSHCYVKNSRMSMGGNNHFTEIEFSLENVKVQNATIDKLIEGKTNAFGMEADTKASVDSLQIEASPAENISVLKEWFINASSKKYYDSLSSYDSETEYHESRGDITLDNKSKGNSRDAFDRIRLECEELKLKADIVYENENRNSTHIPTWTNRLSIEYYPVDGQFPTETERDAIAELYSFLTGKHLTRVGRTVYNNNLEWTYWDACNPVTFGFDIVSGGKNNWFEPVNLGNRGPYCKMGVILNDIIKNGYFQKYKDYSLNEFFPLYWTAAKMGMGVNLVIAASALQNLQNNYSDKNKLPTQYMKTASFKNLLSELFEKICNKLTEKAAAGEADHVDRMMNKIKNANNMGVNERQTIA